MLTVAQRKKILELHDAGVNPYQISLQLGIKSSETVKREIQGTTVIKDNGSIESILNDDIRRVGPEWKECIPECIEKRARRLITPEEHEEIGRLLREGYKQAQIAQIFGFDVGAFSRTLKRGSVFDINGDAVYLPDLARESKKERKDFKSKVSLGGLSPKMCVLVKEVD